MTGPLSVLDDGLTALVDLFTDAAPSDVKVYDGEPIDPPRKFLCVGWDETEDRPAVQVQRQNVGLARTSETYEVSNLLSCWAGNETGPQLRTELMAAFAVFDRVISANRQLAGTVLFATVSDYEYLPDRREEGVIAQIRFTVVLTSNRI